ncbi:hypothetical protein LINGRAHAP2_LOCUS29035, partial [Linum grandiflorum]
IRLNNCLPCASGFSYSWDKLVQMSKYVETVGDDDDLVFVVWPESKIPFAVAVGAMAHGKTVITLKIS